MFLFLNARFTGGAPFAGCARGFLERPCLLTMVQAQDLLAHRSYHVNASQPLVSDRLVQNKGIVSLGT